MKDDSLEDRVDELEDKIEQVEGTQGDLMRRLRTFAGQLWGVRKAKSLKELAEDILKAATHLRGVGKEESEGEDETDK